MATEALYLSNPYLKEAEGKVVMVEFTDLVVDKSVFFPTGEGQPNDKGEVEIDGKKFTIVDTWKDGLWVHLMSLDTYPQGIAGKTVKQRIDWDIRYGHMKFRTALYILSGLAFKKYNATVRINQTYEDYAWIDIIVDNLTEEMVKEFESEANRIIREGIDIQYSFVTREQFSKDNALMSFVRNKIPDYDSIKVAKIGDLPPMPDLGTQVRNTKEVGGLKIKTTLVKGKISNRLTINLATTS